MRYRNLLGEADRFGGNFVLAGLTCSRYATVGAAATAAVMALGLVSVTPAPGGPLAARTEVFAVHLPAAIATEVSALVNSAPHTAAVGIDTAVTTAQLSGDAVTALATSAAATTVDDIVSSVGRVVLNVAGTVLSPIWYLAFPITQGLPSLQSLYGYIPPFPDFSGIFAAVNTISNFFKWLSFPFRLGDVVFPTITPASASARPAATVHTNNPEALATGLGAASDAVDLQDPSAQTVNSDAASAATRAAATSTDDVLSSIGRVAFNIAGTLFSPIWYLAFPVTAQLGSLWGYVEPILADPLLGLTLMMSLANVSRWLYFPFRLGEVLFPPSAPEAAATRPAATFNPAIDISVEPVTDPASAAETTKPGASESTRQRSTTAARRPAAIAAALTPPAAATLDTTTTPELPARSGLVVDAADTMAAGVPQDAPAIAPSSRSDRATKATAQTAAGQHDRSSASTRTGRTTTE